MNFPFRIKKTAYAFLMLTLAGVAVATGCPAVNDSVWEAAMQAARGTLSTGVDGAGQVIMQNRAKNLQRIQSALRVIAKQINLDGEKQAAANTNAKQAAASWVAASQVRKDVFETMMEYNPLTGQGYNPCGELDKTRKISVAIGEAQTDMGEKVIREIDNAPGKVVQNQSQLISQRVSMQKGLYCTADDKSQGYCTVEGNLAGMDFDAANFFSSNHQQSAQGQAKNVMLNHIYGVPYQSPGKEMAATPAGQNFFEAKRAEEAYRSISQNSLKTIQSWTEAKGLGGAGTQSVIDVIAEKIATYAGGADYVQWEKSLASQSEHGLLVSYAKMKALELYMKQLEYQQSERIEANFAAMLAMGARAEMRPDAQLLQEAARKKVQ